MVWNSEIDVLEQHPYSTFAAHINSVLKLGLAENIGTDQRLLFDHLKKATSAEVDLFRATVSDWATTQMYPALKPWQDKAALLFSQISRPSNAPAPGAPKSQNEKQIPKSGSTTANSVQVWKKSAKRENENRGNRQGSPKEIASARARWRAIVEAKYPVRLSLGNSKETLTVTWDELLEMLSYREFGTAAEKARQDLIDSWKANPGNSDESVPINPGINMRLQVGVAGGMKVAWTLEIDANATISPGRNEREILKLTGSAKWSVISNAHTFIVNPSAMQKQVMLLTADFLKSRAAVCSGEISHKVKKENSIFGKSRTYRHFDVVMKDRAAAPRNLAQLLNKINKKSQ